MGKFISSVKASDVRETPDELFNKLHREFHFTLDVCALPENAKLPRYFTPEDNALERDWGGERCWMNPPYSKCGLWMEKAYREHLRGALVVCLVPSATDTRWWHDIAQNGEIRFIKGRIRFKGTPSSAPFPSALVIFRAYNQIYHRFVGQNET